MKYILLLLSFSISIACSAYNPKNLRFHCSNDTIKINELLKEGKQLTATKPRAIISFFADKLLETPYVAHTLEGDKEYLTINIDELDCTTFVETLIALTKTTLAGGTNWRDYAKHLENIRYRKGEMDDYASRLHYISDWVVDNTNRGNVKEITATLPQCKYEIKTIDFMSKNRTAYPALRSDSIMYAKIKNVEMGYRSHRYPIVKKVSLNYKNIRHTLEDGDIIALTTKIDGLDVSHMGIIRFVNKEPYLLHASSIGKKVMIDSNDLNEMLRRSKSNTGIRVIEIIE